jgi:hypothetical protein
MRKLKLELTELEVTSFDTDAVRTSRTGTVAGLAAGTSPNPSCDASCHGGETCEYYSCYASCLDSCGAMCLSAPATNCDFCVTGDLAQTC